MRKDNIVILDRMARGGLIKKESFEQKPQEVKKKKNQPHRCERRVLMAEGTVDAKSLTWVYIHMTNVRSCEKTSMTETEGMRASTDGDEIRKIMKNQ